MIRRSVVVLMAWMGMAVGCLAGPTGVDVQDPAGLGPDGSTPSVTTDGGGEDGGKEIPDGDDGGIPLPPTPRFQPGFHQPLRRTVQTPGRVTYRMKLPIGRTGTRIRVRFKSGSGPLQIHAASIARAGTAGRLTSAAVPLTFEGQAGVTLPGAAFVTTDVVSFDVELGDELAVSMDVEGTLGTGTIMTFPDSYRFPSGKAFDIAPTGGKLWPLPVGVETIQVEAMPQRVFMALGDSITDGYISGDVYDYVSRTDDVRKSWPFLAQRLLNIPMNSAAVSGQGVLEAAANLDTEVLSVEGFTDCVVMLGTNDVALRSATQIISTLESIYARLRPRCKVWGATLPPRQKTSAGDLATANEHRRTVNAWLRGNRALAGLLDFDAALTQPENPDLFLEGLQEDGVHPSERGQAVMAREAADTLAGALSALTPLTKDAIDKAWQVAEARLAMMDSTIAPPAMPKATRPNGTWTTVSATDAIGWTQGFFAGSLWMMFHATDDPVWKARAERWTRPLEAQKQNRTTHDLGFKFMPSYGQALLRTGGLSNREVLLTAAASLASRFDEAGGFIPAGEWNPDWKRPLVVDTMVNLELLLWAADNGGLPEWRQMAVRHAQTTLRDLVRTDGSTFHVVDYDPESFAVLKKETYQGAQDGSTWTRGQVWAMYGYTFMYRYTKLPEMLEAARRVTKYYLSRLPADGVPNWDFSAATWVKDSSAAAASASALLDLATLVPDAEEQKNYRDGALRILGTLSSDAYLSGDPHDGAILKHGAGNIPANQEKDVGLIYGDYYFLEALNRAGLNR